MWNVSKAANSRVKGRRIWVWLYYSAHSEGTFHARFLKFVLGSFGACCKISNFTIFKIRSSPNFYPISSKLYTRCPNHRAIPAIQNLWHFEFFLNAGLYAAGSFKVLFLPQFSLEWSPSKLYENIGYLGKSKCLLQYRNQKLASST